MTLFKGREKMREPLRKRPLHRGAAFLFLLAPAFALMTGAIAACSGTPHIEIEGQKAVLSPILLGTCSIFMKIENSGRGDDILLSAKTDIPGTVTEIHGVADGKMVRRERIPIPAREMVELRPGSLHIMVLRIPRDMRAGGEFFLYLRFERSGEMRVPLILAKAEKTSR